MINTTPDKPPYKLESDGRFMTEALFLETYQKRRTPTLTPVYCFADNDRVKNGKTYVSLKKMYLEMKDPTEYTFAIRAFASWDHWVKLCNTTQLKDYINAMRNELDLLLRAEGLQLLQEHAKTQAAAARYLAEGSFNKKSVGRPKKVNEQTPEDLFKAYEDDFARVEVKEPPSAK